VEQVAELGMPFGTVDYKASQARGARADAGRNFGAGVWRGLWYVPTPHPNPLPIEGRGNTWTSGPIVRGSFGPLRRQNVRVPNHLNAKSSSISFLRRRIASSVLTNQATRHLIAQCQDALQTGAATPLAAGYFPGRCKPPISRNDAVQVRQEGGLQPASPWFHHSAWILSNAPFG
jgi:hypothetical protein